jgi:hypothetical protein
MDKLEVIKKPIEKELSEFKALFDASLKSSTPLLDEVLGYIKQRNGKMMRPILVLLMAKLYGGINDSTLHAALSLELLHTASLVHDDVVDDLFNEVKTEMMQAIREQNLDADRVVDYLMMAKYLEKVGDHAVNIAEWAIFRMTGDMEGARLY